MTSVIPPFLRRLPPIPEPSDYTSNLHSSRLTARVGSWLGVAFGVCFLTGIFSHLHQHPVSWIPLPTRPIWLFQVTQGLHVATGIASIPLLVIKLWVVTPRFWRRPLLTGLVNILERMSILILIAAAAFELISGLLNVAEYYPWTFFFPSVHYAVAWIAIGALIIHIAVKLPVIQKALTRQVDEPDAAESEAATGSATVSTTASAAGPAVEPVDDTSGKPYAVADVTRRPTLADAVWHPETADGIAGDRPGSEPDHGQNERTLSRRGLLVVAGTASGIVTLATIGDRIPILAPLSALAQRSGSGPQNLPVNRTAVAAGVTEAAVASAWRLTVSGPNGEMPFDLAALQRLPQYTADLPIACVEGWSRSASWTGVRFADLLAAAEIAEFGDSRVISLDQGSYGTSAVPHAVGIDPLTLIALRLNGEELDIDHGYPARLIAPARPGVLQTKWLTRIEVS